MAVVEVEEVSPASALREKAVL
ncbi:hypothetical protein SOVF_164840, partial [Spinacia oleracea]